VFSLDNSAVNMTLPAFAAERPAPASVDQYLLPAGRSANLPDATAAVERWERQRDGQTDERTDTRPFHRPSSAY